MGATLGHHSHHQSSWRVAQGIACAADHLLVGFRLGAVRCEASLAECAADHRLVEFLLGAVRIEASLAKGSADHRLVELGTCATLNATADLFLFFFWSNPASTPPPRGSSSKEPQTTEAAPRKDSLVSTSAGS